MNTAESSEESIAVLFNEKLGIYYFIEPTESDFKVLCDLIENSAPYPQRSFLRNNSRVADKPYIELLEKIKLQKNSLSVSKGIHMIINGEKYSILILSLSSRFLPMYKLWLLLVKRYQFLLSFHIIKKV